jgi:hypothetical protein
MKHLHFIFYFVLLSVAAILSCCPKTAIAANKSLTGSISTRESFDSNVNRDPNGEEPGWATFLSPAISFSLLDTHNSFTLNYAPRFTYYNYRNKYTINHSLRLSGNKRFTNNLSVTVNESYTVSSTSFIDEPGSSSAENRLLDETRVRERIRTNTVSTSIENTYGNNRTFSLGYTNNVLRGESAATDDYIRHNLHCTVSHGFSQQWQANTSLNYTKGDFEQSEDLTTLQPGLRINYHPTPHTTLYGGYKFTDTNYETVTSKDYQIQSVSLGWQHGIDQLTSLGMSAGYSAADRGNFTNGAFNYSLQANRDTTWGSVSLNGAGGFDELQFNGANDGLSRFWSLATSLTFKPAEKITADLHASFRQNNFIELAQNNLEKTYTAGGGLTFQYWRWFTLSCRYSYEQLDTDLQTNEFTDHRFYVQLTWSKEMWRW